MLDETVPSGNEHDQETNSPVENPPSPADGGGEKVAYESYKKLLSEKKRIQKELEKVLNESERRKQQELESQEKYKELWESQKTETEALRESVQTYEARWEDALKLNAFNNALGDTKKVESKYIGFIDTSKILIDPETRAIDNLSAQKEVERVMREYPEIVKSTVTTHLPNNKPGPTGTLSYDQWISLPAKEMRARMKEVKS